MSLGIIETRGLVAAIAAGDAMLKAANIALVGIEFIGGNYVTLMIQGDVGAVKAATDAGGVVAAAVGELVAVEVLARPHEEVTSVLWDGP